MITKLINIFSIKYFTGLNKLPTENLFEKKTRKSKSLYHNLFIIIY
jgi:hypothetical protein